MGSSPVTPEHHTGRLLATTMTHQTRPGPFPRAPGGPRGAPRRGHVTWAHGSHGRTHPAGRRHRRLGAGGARRRARGAPRADRVAGRGAATVAELRASALASQGHVRRVTGLDAPAGGGVLVVDRAGWSRANVAAFRDAAGPGRGRDLREARPPARPGHRCRRRARDRCGDRHAARHPLLARAGPVRRVRDAGPAAARRADDPRRRARAGRARRTTSGSGSACTRRRTGSSSPPRRGSPTTCWPRSASLISELMLEPSQFAERLASVARGLPDMLRGNGSGAPLLDALQTPAQRERLAGVTAVMSLLEGHADVVMDDVGPEVVPTVAVIRRRFSRRRAGRGTVDQILRRLLGLDAKARQYADGARFVRAVVDRVGMHGFNAVWSSPGALPKAVEIARPGRLGPPRARLDLRRGRTPARAATAGRPAVAASAAGVRPSAAAVADLGPARPRARRLQRRPRLARAGRSGRQARARGAARGRRRRRRPRLVGGGRARRPPRPPPPAAGWGWRRWSWSVGRRRPGPAGPEAAARDGAVRGARRGGRAPRRSRRPARPHPRRPGRDRAARPRPRARGPGRWPGCRPAAAGTGARCWTCRGRRPPRPAPSWGWPPGTTRPTRTPRTRGSRVRAARGGAVGRAGAGLRREPGPLGRPAPRGRRRPGRRGRRPAGGGRTRPGPGLT